VSKGDRNDESSVPPFPKGVSQPAIRALTAAGYTRYEELAGVSQKQLMELHGLGPKAIGILQDALVGSGLELLSP